MAVSYYASITDNTGTEVLNLEYTGSAKHSAFLATEYIDKCPPAIGFKINKIYIDNRYAASMLNTQALTMMR